MLWMWIMCELTPLAGAHPGSQQAGSRFRLASTQSDPRLSRWRAAVALLRRRRNKMEMTVCAVFYFRSHRFADRVR